MVSPDDGARIAAEMLRIVERAEAEVLAIVSDRIARGIENPRWVALAGPELAGLRLRLERALEGFDRELAMASGDIIERAYMLGQVDAVGDLEAAGAAVVVPQGVSAAVAALATDVALRVSGLTPRIIRTVMDAYQEAVAGVVGNVLLGATTRRTAAQAALDRLLAQGITGFTDAAGRNWHLESYVEMAVRAGAGQAAVAGHTDALLASGHELVQIIPGPRACDICDRWASRVLSLTMATPQVPWTLDDARRAGWGHPNCRCSTAAFFPGVSDPVRHRPDPEGYKLQQQQRYYERRIRYWKRRQALALDPGAATRARDGVRRAQAALREHLAAHPALKRQTAREQVGPRGRGRAI